MTDKPLLLVTARAARGPNDWKQLAQTVENRHRYWCLPTDLGCNHTEPHKHGVACDHTCTCKG